MVLLQKEVKKVYKGNTRVWPKRKPGINTVAYYNINDNDTNSKIYDLSGSYNQTWNGTSSYATDATYGRVASFSGNTSNYTIANSYANFGQDVTLIVLFKTNSSSTQGIIVQGANNSYWPFGITINEGGNGKYDAYYRGTNETVFRSLTSTDTGNRRMIATTHASDGTVKIYIDGVLDNTGTMTGNISYTGGSKLMIGKWRDTYYPFDGLFKLFVGENRVWTDDEIKLFAEDYGFIS